MRGVWLQGHAWRSLLVVAVATVLAAVALALPWEGRLLPATFAAVEGDAGCDVDGVAVDYDFTFAVAPGVPGFRVASVTVSDIAATCDGAQAVVHLTGGGSPLAQGGPAAVHGGAVTLAMDDAPRAEDVDGITVEIDGGETPVPARCSSMPLAAVFVGTTEADRLDGTGGADLIYALPGDDRIDGLGDGDCLSGGTGVDSLDGGAGNDVLLGDSEGDRLAGSVGSDTLIGGDGADRLDGGRGDDVLEGGSGDDEIDAGDGIDTVDGGPGFDVCRLDRRDRAVGCEQVLR